MKTKCIFIIEDNKVFRKITRLVLESHFSERIVSFQSAEEAMVELDVYHPDLVLLDYNLNSKKAENMTGLEYLLKSKKRANRPATIIMSGQESKNIAANLLKAGAVNYLEKDTDSFFENLVGEVKQQLKVLEMQRESMFRRLALKKRLLRTAILIAIPLSIAAAISLLG